MEVKIERLDDFGRGIAYINNKICFIENALPGELVKIKIIKETKKYLEAKVLEYIETSSNRKESKCPYFGICGGCQLGHISIEEENLYKENKLKNLLKKFSNFNSDIVQKIVTHNAYNYRNKLVLHGNNKRLGLYKNNSNEIVEIPECLLVNKKINIILKLLREVNKDIKEAIIRTSNDEVYSLLKIEGEVTNLEKLKEIVDVLIVNDEVLSNTSQILTQIDTKKFLVSANSFFQINKTLTKELYDVALSVTKEKKPNKILDLYCGTGSIGIYVANYCHEIIGIDCNKSNIKDAHKNKALNNLDNITFICDKVENRIDQFKDIDLIIVDPPRAGLDKKTKDYLIKIRPKTIVYISCNPVTLTRDLNDLGEYYCLKFLKPFNMFPRTYHVESVSVLTRKK